MLLKTAKASLRGKNVVAEAYRRASAILIGLHRLDAREEEILFLTDRTSEQPKASGSRIFRIPEIWRDVVYQLTGHDFRYVIKFFDCNLEQLTSRQAAALLYHELRHIRFDPVKNRTVLDLRHDVEEWSELVPFGNWEKGESELPDLFDTPPPRTGTLVSG